MTSDADLERALVDMRAVFLFPLGRGYQRGVLAVSGPTREGEYVLRLVGDKGELAEVKTSRRELVAALQYAERRLQRGREGAPTGGVDDRPAGD